MNKKISDFQTDCRGESRLLARIGYFSKDLLENTLHVFHKSRNGRNISGNFDPAAATSRISDISANLDSVSKGVEAKFIKLGEELQAVFFEATGLADQIAGKAELFGEDSEQSLLVKVRERVEKSLEELREFQDKVIREIDDINQIIEHLRHLHRKCDAFEQTTMYIRVVGLNIGVESTRSAESSEMFSVVSEEIKKVSEKITDINKTILEDSKAEEARQAATSGEISEGMVYLGGLAKDGEQAVRQAVDTIGRLMGVALKTLEDASGHANAISRQVGEIVQGIQFHDNMSQRIEHITSAFKDVENLCVQETEESDPDGTRARELGRAYAIMNIQKAQLERVISEVEQVHRKSFEAFEEIKSRVENLAETLPSFDDNKNEDGSGGDHSTKDPMSALKSALDQIQNIQKKGRKLVERIKVATSHASETAVSLTNHTKLVRRISLETHLMALNAVVKAAHLGESGRTHEVLAQEMRSLSTRSDIFVEDVEKIINQINGAAKDLTGGWNEDGEENSGHHHMADSQDLGVEELTAAYESFVEGSAAILQRAEALNEAISRTSKDLNFLPALSAELGSHLKTVDEAGQIFSPWADADQDGSPERARELAERYTMAEEREIHEQALGVEDGAIELFGEDQTADDVEGMHDNNQNASETSKKEAPGEEDLGDNVELF